MATLTEELQHAAREIQRQVREGLKPDIGSLVLLYHRDGVGVATNLTEEALARALEALLAQVKAKQMGRLVDPLGAPLVGRG
jgi:hypothetical protein